MFYITKIGFPSKIILSKSESEFCSCSTLLENDGSNMKWESEKHGLVGDTRTAIRNGIVRSSTYVHSIRRMRKIFHLAENGRKLKSKLEWFSSRKLGPIQCEYR